MLRTVVFIFKRLKATFSSCWGALTDIFGGIPRVGWYATGLGILFAVGLIFLVRYLIAREKKRKDSPADRPKKKTEIDPYKLPPIGGWLSAFLCRKGFFKIGRLSSDFLNSLALLEQLIKTDDYKYSNPWFLVVGAQGSGKTTLMKSMYMSDVSVQSYENLHRDAECNWHFLRGGVGLDVTGRFVLDPETMSSDDVGWRALKSLLVRYRSSKPIDSLVLTISAEELYGKQRLSSAACLERAKFLTHKLLMFQESLKLRVPIYIVITKTDIIPGFKDFCKQVPTATQQHMLGWSCPYNADTAFSVRWVQEAFGSITAEIGHLSMGVSCNDASDQSFDSMFVFPYELEKTQDNISIYLNQLFGTDQNKVPLLLRGIYFTGDSSLASAQPAEMEIDAGVLDPEAEDLEGEGTAEVPVVEPDRYTSIFFFGDLVYEKILPERNLCVPRKGFLTAANRSLRIVKLSTGVLLVGGSIGIYSAYQDMARSRNALIPAINSMYRFLVLTQQLPTTELARKNEALEGAVKQLDTIMQRMDSAQLSSVFVPFSWMSPLHKKLGKAVNLAYQNVIMRALYVNLMLKTRELLRMNPEQIQPSRSLAQLALPTKSNEFLEMKRFVDGFSTLMKNVDKFNDLRSVPSSRALEDLCSYAFNLSLSASFVEHYKDLSGQLNAKLFPAIDLSVYKAHARKTLTTLFHHFFNTIFIHSNPNSFPAQLERLLGQLQHMDSHGGLDLETLRTLAQDLTVVLITLGEDVKTPTWMDKDVFEPDDTFEQFLCALDQSSFFGPDISQAIVDNCAIGMFHLKKKLTEISQLLTADPRFAVTQNTNDDPRAYSQGLLLFAKAVKTLFDEPYMKAAAPRQFMEVEPEGQKLYWDEKLLQAACELCTQYEAFVSSNTGALPIVLQDGFRLLARDGLQRNVMSLLAQAQTFLPVPANLQNKLVMEEFLRVHSVNLRKTSPHLLKLLELLNYESVSFFYVTLRELLLKSNYWVLGKINDLMKIVGPYHIWDPSFSWWNGKDNPAYMAYGVKDAQDLTSYLNLQGRQTVSLAVDLAKPVVDFLTSDIMLSVNPLDKALISKWRRIVDQAEAFQKKQPGNSIAMLENFINTTFKGYTLENVPEQITVADISSPPGDHFLETILFIKQGILGRVEVLTRKRSMRRYRELAEFFNKRLQGRFPFSSPAVDVLQGVEADPEDLRSFLKKFEKYGASADKVLAQVHPLGGVAREAYTFLKRIEDVYALFQPYLDGGEGLLPFIITDYEFNVNRANAVANNFVAEWSARVNNEELVQHTDKSKQTRWKYGAPTEISFRWPDANTIMEPPFNDPNQPALQVIDRKASFVYKGNWSLLRMVRLQRARPGEYVPMSNPNGVVLKFVIPVSQTKSAILYNLITFFGVAANPNLPGKTLAFPDFPLFAPDFSPEIDRYANEPVLTFNLLG